MIKALTRIAGGEVLEISLIECHANLYSNGAIEIVLYLSPKLSKPYWRKTANGSAPWDEFPF